jgi:anti-sigma regulatory factor (Ser/Thr protein kinase)
MRELSMHILDLAQNSISAGATRLEIEVSADTKSDRLTISIRDNGKGMEPAFVARVKDPFTTTRTTRKVGLGIPMFTEAARACDGDLTVQSEPGNGTTVTAWFKLSHIDLAPLGDIAATLVSIIAANPELSVRYVQRVDNAEFVLDTDDLKSQLDGVPINEGPVLAWIGDYVREHTNGELRIY